MEKICRSSLLENIVNIYYKIYLIVLFVLTLNLISSSTAYAYIDPGSGSFIIQILIAGFLGALFTIKMWWKSFTAFLKNIFTRDKSGK